MINRPIWCHAVVALGLASGCSSDPAPVTESPDAGVDRCGDLVVDVATETCDDGNHVDGDGCSATCQTEASARCGNGTLDAPEVCDDGNHASGDGCSSGCTVEDGYTCAGSPAVCTFGAGTCAVPFQGVLHASGTGLLGTFSGNTSAGSNNVPAASCDNHVVGESTDQVWKFDLAATMDVAITIQQSGFDAGVRLMTSACTPSTEVIDYLGVDGCADRFGASHTETLGYVKLPAGTYYVVIDGATAAAVGTYTFTFAAAPSDCGNGSIDPLENCDDTNATAGDGCSPQCKTEPGYGCVGQPSVCHVTCGDGMLDDNEECDDGNVLANDRCSSTCQLERDVLEIEPNDTTAQVLTAGSHIIRGSIPVDSDVDLYRFTLTATSTVELEVYDTIDATIVGYDGVGLNRLDCEDADTTLAIFPAGADVTDDAAAVAFDDDEGDHFCSYIGPRDGTDDDTDAAQPTQGRLPAGTYTIRVQTYNSISSAARYLLDVKITP